ncbi:hypothetical protein CTI12_AA476400 [Artemisia annua]|uniref:Uncharacterized protein n=1 Tax=Artemisia annua TaxID=35608 RepID=A0A2U1LM35_ARTAN|nr:hypothetical protein CTI12_AA476400 [Artemisia annua]
MYKDHDLVKHGRNLPEYLHCGGESANTQYKAHNFGVLDWTRLEHWKSDNKTIMKTSINNSIPQSDKKRSNISQLSSCSRERLPTGGRHRGKTVKFQLETVHENTLDGSQTSCSEDLSYESNSNQDEQIITSERETSSPENRKYGSQPFSDDVTRNPSNATKRLSEENINTFDELCLIRGHEDALFSLGDFHSSSSRPLRLSDFTESRDGSLVVKERRLYNSFSGEDFSSLNSSMDFPHSQSRHIRTKSASECPYEIPNAPLKNGSFQEYESDLENSTNGEDCLKYDPDIGGQPSVKGRHSTLSKRFSFNLEKVSKSLSFKTSSAYKSLKSGIVSYGLSHDLHDYNSKIANVTNIIKSIPMRRLLDPLLKHKGHQLNEKIFQSNKNIISSPIYDKKPNSSNPRALLQLTLKNEIPFFKLVVDSRSSVLAAGVTKLPSGNNDTSLTYTFYSLHEIKNKSCDRKNQAAKEKGLGFHHNVVGHMKISSSYRAEFSGLERDLFAVRESVLYGPDCMLSGELAAIIVKNKTKENYGSLGSSESTVVILPGGSHSLPKSGEPSSLINRWRSGGACDCGGWDIGCELRVLTDENETNEIPKASTSYSLNLFYKGSHNNKHALSLTTLENGLYSLEYNASISLLQAFSICVAVVSSQNLAYIFQVNHLEDENNFIKPILTKHRKVKSQTIVHPQIAPESPIGRV